MRFEFLEPPQSLQPNLTSAETSGVIPLLKKKLVLVHIYIFFFLQGKEVWYLARRKNALYVEKEKYFKDGKNRLERANQLAALKSL